MTVPSTLIAEVAPAWDPIRRPPRRTASWLALLAVLAGGAYAYHAGRKLVGAPYPALARDICPVVDLQPILKALPGPVATPTAADRPSDADSAGEAVTHRCRFTVTGSDGVTPRAVGEMTVTRYPYAPVAQLYFSVHRDEAAGSIYAEKDVRDVAGLGEEAFSHSDGDGAFQVAARDANLIIDAQLVVPRNGSVLAVDPPEPAFRALSDGIRASFPRLR
ncbi:hypothetical protein [Actinoplanes sp. NPDC049681]|uniref:hypothetical protein n=1 Tax=Actinoplanes sp. NPDC049681 TaxID=3363905 RepID=UPI0037946F6E